MTIGQKLQELRKKQAMSQEALAEKLSVTRQTVSKWELDQSTPDVDMLVIISNIFDVSLDSLMRKKEMPMPRMEGTANNKPQHDWQLVLGISMTGGSLLIMFILFIISIFKPIEYINKFEGIFLTAKSLNDKYDWF